MRHARTGKWKIRKGTGKLPSEVIGQSATVLDMEGHERIRLFRWGLLLCWTAILAIPAGMPLIRLGPCLGTPDTVAGSMTLLILGLFSTVGAVLGIGAVIRGIGAVEGLSRLGGGLSILIAGIALLPGLVYLLSGFFSTQYMLGR